MKSAPFLAAVMVAPALAQVPSVPADIPVERFARLPQVDHASLSPDGEFIAYFSPIDGRRNLILQSLDGESQPYAVPAEQGLDFDWLHWVNEKRLVFLISSTGRRGITETNESRLWAIDRDGTDAVHIIRPVRQPKIGTNLGTDLVTPQVQSRVISWLPWSPHEILVGVDGDHDGGHEVRRVDVNSGRFRVVRDDYPFVQHWIADQTGDLRFGWGYKSEGRRVIQNHDDSDWDRVDDLPWQSNGFFPAAFLQNQDLVYMSGIGSEGTRVFRIYDVDDDTFGETVFENPVYDADELVFDYVTSAPIGVQYTEHYPKTAYFDAGTRRLQEAIDAALPDTNNELVGWSRDRRRVLIRAASDVDSGTYALLDRDQKELSYFAEINAGLPSILMSPTRPVSFTASDGMEIYGYLTVPIDKGVSPVPAVIYVGDFPTYRAEQSFSFLAQFLASRGYAALALNVRGSTGYGQLYREARNGEWGKRLPQDVKEASAYLIDTGVVNPGQICVLGWGFGSVPTINALAHDDTEFACAVSINGVLNLPQWISDRRHYLGGESAVASLGLSDINPDTDSPYHQVEQIKAPMLVIQSKDDDMIVETHGRRMADRMNNLNMQVEYLEIDDGRSQLGTEAARATALAAIESFLEQALGSN